MSIYATLWALKFPRRGVFRFECEWITVVAQGVPDFVGDDPVDPYAAFLPERTLAIAEGLRAVVFVTQGAPKGTRRAGQEYVAPLLVLSGKDYATIPFTRLYAQLCTALTQSDPD
jgi:hypothetical protein